MTKIFVAAILLCGSSVVTAQFGASLKYQSIPQSYGFADSLEAFGGKFNNQLLGGTVFYWFRLKNRRLEFLPEIGYWSTINQPNEAYETRLRKFSLSFNTDLYIFDFEGDCDCPTFSKQGGYFQKGFFLEVTPGMDMQDFFINTEEDTGKNFEDTQVTFRLGLGAGFDFGISDMITITPTAGMHWSSRPEWYHTYTPDDASPSGGEWIFVAGIRLLFRPDY